MFIIILTSLYIINFLLKTLTFQELFSAKTLLSFIYIYISPNIFILGDEKFQIIIYLVWAIKRQLELKWQYLED
jgi:hypothetical protein